MKRIFNIDVTIHASAYVLAETEEEARAKAVDSFTDAAIYLDDDRREYGDVTISGEYFSEDMPEVSLSPAMTVGAVGDVVDVTDFAEEQA